MRLGIEAVNNGSSLRAASSAYQMTTTALFNHLKNPSIKTKTGPATLLTEIEESKLYRYISGCAERGSPLSSADVCDAASKLFRLRNRSDARVLGKGWFQSFKTRHKLSFRIPDKISKASANVNPENIKGWFNQINSFIETRLEYAEALSDSTRVFNADESMLMLNPVSARVLVPEGMKHVYSVSNDHKAGLTVMSTFRADGKSLKPFIIYPQQRVTKNVDTAFPYEKAKLRIQMEKARLRLQNCHDKYEKFTQN